MKRPLNANLLYNGSVKERLSDNTNEGPTLRSRMAQFLLGDSRGDKSTGYSPIRRPMDKIVIDTHGARVRPLEDFEGVAAQIPLKREMIRLEREKRRQQDAQQ